MASQFAQLPRVDGRDDFKDPVECKDVLAAFFFTDETIGVEPAASLDLSITVAVVNLPQLQPHTSHHVVQVDDVEDDTGEADEVVRSRMRQHGGGHLDECLHRRVKLEEPHDTQALEPVVMDALRRR